MFSKLNAIEQRYDELDKYLNDMISAGASYEQYKSTLKEQSDLRETVELYRQLKRNQVKAAELEVLLEESANDIELSELINQELSDLETQQKDLINELRLLLVPKDPNDNKHCIVEIRAASGGDEATLFAATLFRMYVKYAERKSWKIDILDSHETDLGGFKEIVVSVDSDGAYGEMKHESGVHRIQRVSPTDSADRVHTSTATVAVLLEAEEIDINIKSEDLEIQTFRSGGAGGQNVNKVSSAVRITHLPTNTIVKCQSERSQLHNKESAMKQLRALLFTAQQEKQLKSEAEDRRSKVKDGKFSDKIRTYNFKDSRCVDHRSGYVSHNLDSILNGDIEELIESLKLNDNSVGVD